jgi:hypothetical protein
LVSFTYEIGKIFPIYARKYVSIEDVLVARVGKGGYKSKK